MTEELIQANEFGDLIHRDLLKEGFVPDTEEYREEFLAIASRIGDALAKTSEEHKHNPDNTIKTPKDVDDFLKRLVNSD